MRADQVKFRCSALGKIMTNARSKSETLSKTTKSYIKELFMELEWNIVEDISTPAMEKGNIVEAESIKFANTMLSLGLTDEQIENNSQRYRYNDFVHGSTDLETDDLIIDVKNPFTIKTFPMFSDDELPNKHYSDQMQGYMWLSNKDKAMIVYTAIESPSEMIYDDIRKQHWKKQAFWDGEEDEAIVEAVTNYHTFPLIENENRIRVYEVDRNEERIEQIKERIGLCREYYNTLLIEKNRPDAV